jgi:hypothetical protein
LERYFHLTFSQQIMPDSHSWRECCMSWVNIRVA